MRKRGIGESGKIDSKIWEKVIDVDKYPHFVEIYVSLLFVIDIGQIYMCYISAHLNSIKNSRLIIEKERI